MLPAVISMTDSELRENLRKYGCNTGPVTDTTRNVLLKKLNSLIIKSQSAAASDPNVPNVATAHHHDHAAANQSDEELQLAFFDIETSGLEIDCDVLQIAVKIGSSVFNEYIKPSKLIPQEVTLKNSLTNRNGVLYLGEEIVPAKPVRTVLEDLLGFIKTLKKRCVFVAHNCPFDAIRLLRIIEQESMKTEFVSVIAGFTDTLAMFRKKFPERRGKGSCTLTTLATQTLSLSTAGAHNAINDVVMLEKLALHHFTIEQLITEKKSFADI